MEQTEAWVMGLTVKTASDGCRFMRMLQAESMRSNEVYRYFDRFVEMLSNENSYVRSRALILIAANARWDSENRLGSIFRQYLSHILDSKPITARQCVKCLPEIAACKPELRQCIREALQSADLSGYADSMRPLIARDISETLRSIGGE